jgi:ribosome-binding factor A
VRTSLQPVSTRGQQTDAGNKKGNPMQTPPTQRQLKVGEELRHALSDIFLREDFYTEDGKTLKVTVSEVRASPDLKNATVFVMPLAGKNIEHTMKSLKIMALEIRHHLGKRIRLRILPRLTFRLDDTFEKSQKINDILQKPEVKRDLE